MMCRILIQALIVSVLIYLSHCVNISCKLNNKLADCHRLILDHIPTSVPDHITTLNMSGNILKGISHHNFSRFTKIEVINLSDNYIETDNIDQYSFTGLQFLHTVDLTDNSIKKLKRGFLNTTNIKKLILDENEISEIEADFLILLGSLTHLSLRKCGLRFISPQAFNLFGGRLQYLDISENKLKTLDSQLQPYIFSSALKELKIYRNWWVCDCHLKWLRVAISQRNGLGDLIKWRYYGDTIMPECDLPESLKHEKWLSKAPVEKFGCPPELIKTPDVHYIDTETDLKITVLAETLTNPDSVTWLQNGYKLYWRDRLHIVKSWNQTVYNTTLTISGFTESDYGLYSCTIKTEFGSARKEIRVRHVQVEEDLSASVGVIVAIVIVSILVILITVLLVLFCLKKRCGYSGKWDMHGNSKSSSAVSRSDCYVSAEDVADDTPLSPTQPEPVSNGPDVVKVYAEEELIALPADDEYPEDDAGCKEYNEYLELTKPNPRIHSPNTSSSSSQSHNGLIGPPPFQPAIVPYTPSVKSYDGTPQQTLHTTSPSGSPLTYIKEEVEEDVL